MEDTSVRGVRLRSDMKSDGESRIQYSAESKPAHDWNGMHNRTFVHSHIGPTKSIYACAGEGWLAYIRDDRK